MGQKGHRNYLHPYVGTVLSHKGQATISRSLKTSLSTRIDAIVKAIKQPASNQDAELSKLGDLTFSPVSWMAILNDSLSLYTDGGDKGSLNTASFFLCVPLQRSFVMALSRSNATLKSTPCNTETISMSLYMPVPL